MIDLNKKFTMCSFCGVMIMTKEIYIDYSLDEYTGLCREHFYRKYDNDVQGYYNLVRFFDDAVITEDDFEVKRKLETGIHYEFNFPESEYGIFDEENREKFRKITYGDIVTEKSKQKFEFIDLLSTEEFVDGVFTLRYDLKVLFKSYLEYLENQLFLTLRSYYLSMYRESLEQEKRDTALIC